MSSRLTPPTSPQRNLAASAEPHDDEPIETEEEIEIPESTEALCADKPATPEPDEPECTVELVLSEPLEPRTMATRDDAPPLAASPSISPMSLPASTGDSLVAVPPAGHRWVEVTRRHPVLWMVLVPVLLASLLILSAVSSQTRSRAKPQPAEPTLRVAAAAPARDDPASAAPSASTSNSLDARGVAALEGRDSASLTARELLLLNDSRAQRKREAALALSQKLQAQPELAKGADVQGELLAFATDPDTAAAALAAIAEAPAPIGADLLYEVSMSRLVPRGTAELARSLLYSRDVRPGASAALAAALALHDADSCDAARAALLKAQTDGDRRSLSQLGKLSYRRGCGKKKLDDCYPCLRSSSKQLVATAQAAQSRRPPSYPTIKQK